jgi:hypothetical protein
MDERATAPVVGKALEIALVVAYIGLVAGGLYGGVVPDTRTTADQAIAERTVAASVEEIRAAIPPTGIGVVQVSITLPSTIGGDPYVVVPHDGYLILRHPDPSVDAKVSLLLAPRVTAITGRWESGASNILRVNATQDGVIVRLENR